MKAWNWCVLSAGWAEGELWWVPVSHLLEYWCSNRRFVTIWSVWWAVNNERRNTWFCIISYKFSTPHEITSQSIITRIISIILIILNLWQLTPPPKKKAIYSQAIYSISFLNMLKHLKPSITSTLTLFLPLFHSFHVGICSATTPFVLLGDVLDCLPLDQCDKIFSFVEENVSTWKSVNKLQPFSKGSWSISPAYYT